MYSVILENENGDELKLTNNINYAIDEIDGLYPSSATINTSNMSLFDGEKFTSSKVNKKQITITFYIERNVEENRIALYKFIQPKEFIRFRYKNSNRDVYIDGYVESLDIDIFTKKQFVTVAILCPNPYFRDASNQHTNVNAIDKKLVFPLATPEPIPFGAYENISEIILENKGDVATGMQIEIHATGTVRNPIIYNSVTKAFFKLNYTMKAGEIIYVSTYKGRKTVKTLIDGQYKNIFNSIEKGSSWLQLKVGTNILTYDADVEDEKNMHVDFIYQNLYRGV